MAIQKALEFDLNNGATPVTLTPTHRLEVAVTPSDITVSIDPVTGRSQEEIGSVTASYQLVETLENRLLPDGYPFSSLCRAVKTT